MVMPEVLLALYLVTQQNLQSFFRETKTVKQVKITGRSNVYKGYESN